MMDFLHFWISSTLDPFSWCSNDAT